MSPEQQPPQNHGVKLGRRPTDFIAGQIPYEVRNPSGDWTKFIPSGERQYNRTADSMSCVTFSLLNAIETYEKFWTGSSNNYSDRWTAKMSQTTVEGNWLWMVAETVKQFGLVLESDYPNPPEPWTFPQYHSNILEPLYSTLSKKGQNWRLKWKLNYEEIPVNAQSFAYHLKHGVLQIVIPGHAQEGIYQPGDITRVLDTYEPFIKSNNTSNIVFAYKIILTPNLMNKAKIVKSKKDATVYIAYPISKWDLLVERASLEGIVIPDPVPDTDSL